MARAVAETTRGRSIERTQDSRSRWDRSSTSTTRSAWRAIRSRFFRRGDAMFVKNVGRLRRSSKYIEQTEAQIFPGDAIEILASSTCSRHLVREAETRRRPGRGPTSRTPLPRFPMSTSSRAVRRSPKTCDPLGAGGEVDLERHPLRRIGRGQGCSLRRPSRSMSSFAAMDRFLAINMASLSPGLIEVDLFGERAASTDGRHVSRASAWLFKAQGGMLLPRRDSATLRSCSSSHLRGAREDVVSSART